MTGLGVGSLSNDEYDFTVCRLDRLW